MQLPTKISSPPFLGAEVAATYDNARVVILPIPFEATTTYRRGCEKGPDAILEASGQLEFYDEELDWEICFDVGIHTHPAIADTRQGKISSEQMLQVTQETMSALINDGKFVIGLGGEQYYYGHSPIVPPSSSRRALYRNSN